MAFLDVRELFRFLRVNRRMCDIVRSGGAILRLSSLNWPEACPGTLALGRMGRIAAWQFTPTIMDRRTVARVTGRTLAVNGNSMAYVSASTAHLYTRQRNSTLYIGAPLDFIHAPPEDMCLQAGGTIVLTRGGGIEVVAPEGRRVYFYPPCHKVRRVATHNHNTFLAVTDHGALWRCRYHHIGLHTETTHMGTVLTPSRCIAGRFTGPVICSCTIDRNIYVGCTYGLFKLGSDEELTCVLHGAPVIDLCEFTGGLAALSSGNLLSIFKNDKRVAHLLVQSCKGISSFHHLVLCGGTTVNARTLNVTHAPYPHLYHRVVTSDGTRSLEHLAVGVVLRKEMQAVPMCF